MAKTKSGLITCDIIYLATDFFRKNVLAKIFIKKYGIELVWFLSGYHADTPITIKAEPFIWPTAALINIHEHPI